MNAPTRVKVTDAAIAAFAKSTCNACGGVGVLTAYKAELVPWTGKTRGHSSLPGRPVTRLCGCGLRRVLRIPGVTPDPETRELYFTPPEGYGLGAPDPGFEKAGAP